MPLSKIIKAIVLAVYTKEISGRLLGTSRGNFKGKYDEVCTVTAPGDG